VHRAGMGPFTAVARVEDLSYQTAPPFDLHGRRQTAGVKVRIVEPLALTANVIHQSGGTAEYGSSAIDVGFTFSIRPGRR
jgi:hypothetical protein